MLADKIWKATLSLSFFKKVTRISINMFPTISYNYSKYQNKSNRGFQRSSNTFLGKRMEDEVSNYQKKENLNDYLNDYLSKLEKGNYILLNYVKICKSIANYYTKEKHQQFIKQRIELQKMIDTFSSLQTGQPSFQDYFDLMDFLKIMESIEPINKTFTHTLKDILFSKISPILQKLEDIRFQDLIKLYCKISLLNSPSTQKIGKFLYEKIQKKFLNQQRIINAAEAEMVFRSLGQRKFLYHFDNNIFRILLLDLRGNIQPTDNLLIIKIADAINSCNVRSSIADWEILSIVKQIINKATQIIKEGYNHELVGYLLLKSCSSGSGFAQIYQTIYKFLLERIERGDKSPKLLKQFCSVLQKKRSNLYKTEDIKIVISYIRTSFQNTAIKSIVFKQQSMELIIIEMIRLGFFDSNITLLNEIIILPRVEMYWSLVVQYSIRNASFPIDPLVKKIKPKTLIFEMDNNYLKAAASIGCQHRLQPTNQLLSKSYQHTVNSIKCKKWTNEHWNWLLKQSVMSMKLSRLYFQQYSQTLIAHFNPHNSQKYIKQSNSNSNSISPFWKYFLTVADLNSKNEQLLNKMPVETIQAISFRQISKPNQETVVNKLLLKAVIININNGHLNLQKLTTKGLLFLLKRYSEEIVYQKEQAVQLYWTVAIQLVQYFKKIPAQNQIYVKAIILRSINIQSPIIENSLYFKAFISEVFKQVEYFSKSLYQKDLIVSLIRRGLQHRLVTAKHLNLLNIEDSYFTEFEKNMIKSIKNEYTNNGNVCYSSLMDYLIQGKKAEPSVEILNGFHQIIESCSLRALQKLVLYFPELDKKKNDEMFLKIFQKLTQKLQVGEVDIIGILKSINHQSIDLQTKILPLIANKLTLNPQSLYLSDHLQIIKLVKRSNITHKEYYQSLLNFIVKSQANPKIIEIALQLKSSGITFSKQLMEVMREIAGKNSAYEIKGKELQA